MAWCFQFSHFHCTLNSVLLFFFVLVVLSLRVSARVLASASSLFLFLHFTITTLTCEHHFPFPIFQSFALHSQKNVYTKIYIAHTFVAISLREIHSSSRHTQLCLNFLLVKHIYIRFEVKRINKK